MRHRLQLAEHPRRPFHVHLHHLASHNCFQSQRSGFPEIRQVSETTLVLQSPARVPARLVASQRYLIRRTLGRFYRHCTASRTFRERTVLVGECFIGLFLDTLSSAGFISLSCPCHQGRAMPVCAGLDRHLRACAHTSRVFLINHAQS